ncbi:16S rRNA (cytosine(1402)-N(4))-methyltransferase, partial [uncultured Campylobacter sp.]
MNSPHVPVLLNEVLQAFEDIKSGVIVDCTLGYGGHS